MGRKRRDMSCLKPFCFYCEKSFKNQVILHHHQKAKHFSCPKCPKKFSSIDSMTQHARSSHNQQVERVPNSNAGRDNVSLKIFGMQGVPRIQIQSWISKNVNRYWGKIMEKKLAERKKELLEKKQLRQQQAQLNNIDEEKQQNQQVQQEFNLQFKFPTF